MEFPIIFYLSTPVKVPSNGDSFNDSNDTANTKVISEQDGSYIAKNDEVTLNNLRLNILNDLKKEYPSSTVDFSSTVITSLKDHIKSLESEIQFLRNELKGKPYLFCL